VDAITDKTLGLAASSFEVGWLKCRVGLSVSLSKSGVAKAAPVAPMAPSLYTTVNQKHGYSFVRLQYMHGYQQHTT